MTLEQLLGWGEEELEKAGVPEAGLSAWYLLQACLQTENRSFSRSDYFLHKTDEAEEDLHNLYERYVAHRRQRIPLEYITGSTEFMGLPFVVNEHVLVPRQDTETLVELIYPLCEGRRVLDLCTGSGCIGLSIGIYGKPSGLVLSDISKDALMVAEENLSCLRELPEGNSLSAVEVIQSDLFENIEGVFDVIVSNPPYIESDVVPGLMPEVSRYEPVNALDGGKDGLDFYREIIRMAPDYLNKDGILCFEIGYNQGESVSDLMKKRGFIDVRIDQDLAGNDRIVKGKIGSCGK